MIISIRSSILMLFIILFAMLPNAGGAKTTILIIGGSGGIEDYQQKFTSWGARLKHVLTVKLGHPEENVCWMAERSESIETPDRETSLFHIRSEFNELESKMTDVDDLFVFLTGHGSSLRNEPKFQIPGPDLTAGELNRLVSRVNARRTAVIDTSSSSAGFINILSVPGRIVCTAVKNVNERNAPEFMEFLLQGLEDGSADTNRDGRISILEACGQAASLTDAWYTGEGNLATEHALMDDNGDGRGTRLPIVLNESESDPGSDGHNAANCFLKEHSFSPDTPPELIKHYLSVLETIGAWKKQKNGMDGKDYYAQLEALLIEAAKAHRAIRDAASQ